MKKNMLSKTLVLGIVILFVGAVVIPSISSVSNQSQTKDILNGRASFNPFLEGWKYRKMVPVNHEMVAGNLVDFPVLVSYTDVDLRDKAQFDGDDILFMDDKGEANQLFHEIEYFDSSTGKLVAWVYVPALFSDKDTVFYMYYGNQQCASQEFPEMVWDSDFCGVWHLDGLDDSTSNDNDGSNQGTDSYEGKIGNARDFSRSTQDFIDLGDISDLAGSSSKATFEVWLKPDLIESNIGIITKWNNLYEPDRRSYFFTIDSPGKIEMGVHSGTWYPQGNKILAITDGSPLSTGIWQQIVAVVDLSSNSIDIYYNGEEVSSTLTMEGSPPSYFYDIAVNEWLGRYAGEYTSSCYDGCMDEVRISNICRSEEWIETSFNNMNDPEGFSNFCSEVTNYKENINLESTNVINDIKKPSRDINTFTPTDDTFIVMKAPDGNSGDRDEMFVRNRYGHPYHPYYWERDILIKFDISSIPSNAIINSAKLYIYYFAWKDNNPVGRDLNLYRITNNWHELIVTWNTRPSFDPMISSSAIVPSSSGVWMEWDVTSDVEKFVKGEETNYGWQIMDEEPWGNVDIPISKFRTKEYSDSEYFPYLEIDFTKSKNKDVTNQFFIQFLESHPNIFPLLQQLLVRFGL
jgi:hypothetical protein